jgi:hypothetical protein
LAGLFIPRLVGAGGRCTNVNAFMDSLRLGKFKHLTEQRKRIVKRIKELQPKVTNRQIARTLGVDAETVRRDTGAANAAPSSKDANGTKSAKGADAANAARGITGERAAKLVLRRETASADGIAKVAAEDAILLGNKRIAEELRKVPKATHKAGPKKAKSHDCEIGRPGCDRRAEGQALAHRQARRRVAAY